jgi:hypothetical protein
MYLYLAVAIFAALSAAAGTWRVQEWRYGAKEAERMEAVKRDRMRAEKNIDTAAVGHESDKVRIETEFLIITERVGHVLQTDFYAAGAPACLDDAGVRAVADALRPADAASQPAPAVRGPRAAP